MKTTQTSAAIRLLKPRNPFVALTRLRRAGSHQADGRSQRQQDRRALRRELEHMKHSP